MNCERVKELLADALEETLDARAKGELMAHLSRCTSCREETTSLQSTWEKLSSLPEQKPSPALDDRVQATLEAYREGMMTQAERQKADEGQPISGWLWSLWPKQPASQFAMVVLLFSLGLFLGLGITRTRHYDRAGGIDQAAIAQLREEIATMKQLLTLSLLEQPSASERLRGVEWTSRLDQPGAQVLSVLLRVLELDSNVNVRLAAVGALQQFPRDPRVRKGLIDVLARSQSQSPLVQIDLIDAMVRANEKDSVVAIRALLQNPQTDPSVRERAEWALQKLT